MERRDVRTVNLRDMISPLTVIEGIEEIYIFSAQEHMIQEASDRI